MAGFDLLVERRLTPADVKNILVAAQGIAEPQVLVLPDYPEAPLPPDTRILCMTNDTDGDFRSHLSIDFLDDGIVFESHQLAKRIAEIAKCTCLLPSADINPFKVTVVSPGQPDRIAFLKATGMDDGRYSL